jgi:hypothetical protein
MTMNIRIYLMPQLVCLNVVLKLELVPMRALAREKNRPKKEVLLNTQAIVEVSTKICCCQNYLQPFPHGQIQAIRYQIHVDGRVYFQKSHLLEVHKQIHHNVNGREVITLVGREVYPIAWWTIHGLLRATFCR